MASKKSASSTTSSNDTTSIVIYPRSASAPQALLATAVVAVGDLMVLAGFDIWEDTKGAIFVTPPRRSSVVNGVRKSFDYARPSKSNPDAFYALKTRIVAAYEASEHARPSTPDAQAV